jgi:transposase
VAVPLKPSEVNNFVGHINAQTGTTYTLAAMAAWRARDEDLATAVARKEAGRLAKRVIAADRELAANTKQMTDLLNRSPARALLDQPGIGPVTAAVALAAWSHPGRVRSEAGFASLAGVNPIPASSGNTVRHRINRGGDRRLNRALHMAAVTRIRMDPRTRSYVERRTTEGRTPREIRRCATSPARSTASSTLPKPRIPARQT